MKHPKSPGVPEDSSPPRPAEEERQQGEKEEQEEEERMLPAERRPKRERRQGSVTLCEVCNIQLNSTAQAQIHYNGKTHQRRLRQYNKAAAAAANAHTGTLSQANPLLASLSLPGRPLQHQLDFKHFLPLRANGSSHLSLFPNFHTMDPVQKAVINHTFGVAPPKKKQIISCNICHLRFNSTRPAKRCRETHEAEAWFTGMYRTGGENQAEAHYKGHKHARKLKAMDPQRSRARGPGSAAGRDRERDREKERGKSGGTETLPALMNANLTEAAGLPSTAQPPGLNLDASQGAPLTAPAAEPLSLATPPPPVSPASRLTPESIVAEGRGGPSPTSDTGRPEPPAAEGNPPGLGDEEPQEGKKSPTKKHLHCPVCKVTVNSTSQMEAHYSGSKHKQMLEGQAGQTRRRGRVTLSPRATCRTKQPIGSKSRAGMGAAGQAFHCEVCEVSVNSETQLKQHMSSRRHKERLAGKPPKPKFSPYTKSQANPVLATLRWSFPFAATPSMGKLASLCLPNAFSPQTKLALQKQLSKTLPPGFLTSHLNPATFCTMASSHMHLRPQPGPATIIQSPLLSPALFRPAPGPLRATHTPIIFSPY